MQLNTSQPDLSQMFGQGNLFSTLYGMNREDQANANQAQNLSQAQQDQNFQAQNQPAQLALLQAQGPEAQARANLMASQTPGAAAQSQIQQNSANADSSIPASVRNNAALHAKLAAMSDDDIKMVENTVVKNMADPDPQVRAGAQTIYDNLPAMKQMRTKLTMEGNNSARVAGIEGGNQVALEKQRAADGAYARNSIDYLITKGQSGTYQQQSGAWTMRAAQAEDQGDSANAQRYRELADAAKQAGTSQAAAAAYTNLAKSIDTSGLGVPMVVRANQTPGAPQQTQQPAEQGSPTKVPPKAGDKVMHGGDSYTFMGGDPSNPSNWRKQ